MTHDFGMPLAPSKSDNVYFGKTVRSKPCVGGHPTRSVAKKLTPWGARIIADTAGKIIREEMTQSSGGKRGAERETHKSQNTNYSRTDSRKIYRKAQDDFGYTGDVNVEVHRERHSQENENTKGRRHHYLFACLTPSAAHLANHTRLPEQSFFLWSGMFLGRCCSKQLLSGSARRSMCCGASHSTRSRT